MIVLVLICAVLAMPGLAQAGTRVRGSHTPSGSTVQVPFYWHPFFYPGPFVYGYPGGFNYAFPGPYVSSASTPPYTYGYPGPFDYGTWTYAHPRCFAKPDGYWICS